MSVKPERRDGLRLATSITGARCWKAGSPEPVTRLHVCLHVKRHGSPDAINIDGLRSYRAAMSEPGKAENQETGRRANNPVTRDGTIIGNRAGCGPVPCVAWSGTRHRRQADIRASAMHLPRGPPKREKSSACPVFDLLNPLGGVVPEEDSRLPHFPVLNQYFRRCGFWKGPQFRPH